MTTRQFADVRGPGKAAVLTDLLRSGADQVLASLDGFPELYARLVAGKIAMPGTSAK